MRRRPGPAARPIVDIPAPQRRLSEAEIDDVEAAYIAGQFAASIAQRYGVRRKTIAHRLRARGLRLRRDRAMTDELVAACGLRYADGATLAQLADITGIGQSIICRELHRASVPLRPRGGRR